MYRPTYRNRLGTTCIRSVHVNLSVSNYPNRSVDTQRCWRPYCGLGSDVTTERKNRNKRTTGRQCEHEADVGKQRDSARCAHAPNVRGRYEWSWNYTAAVSSWHAASSRTRPTRPLGCHKYVARVGRVDEDVTRMLRGRYEDTASVDFRLINSEFRTRRARLLIGTCE